MSEPILELSPSYMRESLIDLLRAKTLTLRRRAKHPLTKRFIRSIGKTLEEVADRFSANRAEWQESVLMDLDRRLKRIAEQLAQIEGALQPLGDACQVR